MFHSVGKSVLHPDDSNKASQSALWWFVFVWFVLFCGFFSLDIKRENVHRLASWYGQSHEKL